MIFLSLLVLSCCQLSTAVVILEHSANIRDIMSIQNKTWLKEWYGDSPYSITCLCESCDRDCYLNEKPSLATTSQSTTDFEHLFTDSSHVTPFPLQPQPNVVVIKTRDSKCDFVTSAVTAALARKRNFGILTEAQESVALNKFQRCQGTLCKNSAMLDAFMRPKTFREQVDLLVAMAKLGDILRGRESAEILLNLLVDGELKEILSAVPYPPKFTNDSNFDMTPYIEVAIDVLEAACTPGTLLARSIDISGITTIFIAALSDRYTKNAISAEDVATVRNMTRLEDVSNLWNGIADKIASPTSTLTTTCLDPAVGYFNYEKISLVRIRRLAVQAGFCVEGEGSGMTPGFQNDLEMSGSDDVKMYDAMAAPPMFDYMDAGFAPPPVIGPDGGGPPSQSGSSPMSAPNMPGPSFNGPPV